MQSSATSIQAYLDELPEERKSAISHLREIILNNLPEGFSETMNYGMIGYVVPLTMYPQGYLNDPKAPLPFVNIASQKHFIAFYHMGLVADKQLSEWFRNEYPKHCKTKLDMGKSCIRFKKPDQIPYNLIGELVTKMTPEQWIKFYETAKTTG